MKSVFVQCELWCDEILRRVARPCCTCHRIISAQALADLAPGERLRAAAGAPCASAPGVDVTVRPCRDVCRAPKPTPGCEPTASYMLYSTEYNRQRQYVISPTRLSPSPSETVYHSFSPPAKSYSMSPLRASGSPLTFDPLSSLSNTGDIRSACGETSAASYYTSVGPSVTDLREQMPSGSTRRSRIELHSLNRADDAHAFSAMEVGSEIPTRTVPLKEAYSGRTPTISTDQMADWHAMMVSLTWNVQAWRNWIQETIDRALVDHSYGLSPVGAEENWSSFHRRIATEALQWRQYNLFSRQLTLRLALRYQDKKIVSPTRATVKTPIYMECQKEMLEIINMFNRWTHWLSVVVKESDSVQFSSSSDTPFDDQRWSYFKSKVEEYAEDWQKYSMYLKVCWEQIYMMPLKDWMPSWGQPGPVWVMSACGAVPSGAVPAGAAAGERTWLARTTHARRVLPAALVPSKHCCLVYADGAVHHYTKYQVLVTSWGQPGPVWVMSACGAVPSGAVPAGAAAGERTWLARTTHARRVLPAALVPSKHCCLVYADGAVHHYTKYQVLVTSWGQPGPVWVMSACGAVPSGAVPAGAAAGERTWLARTTHARRVLPAALVPSKHCCLVYADGAVYHYTKYQVMCNAEVVWVSWRAGAAGAAGARAVRVAPGVLAGRVLYRGDHLVGAVLAPHHRCHVVIFGRPFAFNCYELLVMADPV